MVYELCDTSRVAALFEGWQESMILSCLQKVMGKLFVTNRNAPKSALAFVGCFGFYAGTPDRELSGISRTASRSWCPKTRTGRN